MVGGWDIQGVNSGDGGMFRGRTRSPNLLADWWAPIGLRMDVFWSDVSEKPIQRYFRLLTFGPWRFAHRHLPVP